MASCASIVHHFVIDSIFILNLLLFINSLLQELLHLFNTVMRLVLSYLVDLYRNLAFLTNFNLLGAYFRVLLYLTFVDFGSTVQLTEVASILAVLLMLNSLRVLITNEPSISINLLGAVFHWTVEPQLHEYVVNELMDLNILCIRALERAVSFLLTPLLDTHFAK